MLVHISYVFSSKHHIKQENLNLPCLELAAPNDASFSTEIDYFFRTTIEDPDNHIGVMNI